MPVAQKKVDLRAGAFSAQVSALLLYELFLIVAAVKGLQTEATFEEKVEFCFYVESAIVLNIGVWVILRHFKGYPLLFHNFFKLLAEYEGKKSVNLLRL